MNEKKLVIYISLLTLLIIGGGVFLLSAANVSAPKVVASTNTKAETVEPTSYDFGTIKFDGEKATKVFTIINTGTETLKLYNLKTSCHCTKVHVTINGSDSPDFGMSGISDWVGNVAPGKEAKITVVFNQAYHGSAAIGPITRFVSVETNDKATPKITYTLTGTVVK